MNRELRITEDGSHTLYLPDMDENYHSTHGAIQESMHVFIDAGLKHLMKNEVVVFEVGFGTGLNALLTLLEAKKTDQHIHYYSIEKYPLQSSEYSHLNYPELLTTDCRKEFQALHESAWNKVIDIAPDFHLTKLNDDITTINLSDLPPFDLIYFDAFAPNKQTGVWNIDIFRKLQANCNPSALIVTYCAKGSVRRDLQEVGFTVERIAGPPGKKEMLRGIN